ncbi:MAG: KamA family radical SAM protein [Candidatus Pacearchaeota archaeon]|nr:KamA family radical SAM protein [Candidatus Pacearchaeota archaeon]
MNRSDSSSEKSDDEPPNPLNLEGLVSLNEIVEISGLSKKKVKEICNKYPIRIPRYYFSLIKERGDGIYKQCMPSPEELLDYLGEEDPLNEESKIEGSVPKTIIHRYPDRLVLQVSNQCAMYCRFCTRKRKVGDLRKQISWDEIKEGIDYIKEHEEIRDVLLSGGDPLMLPNGDLEKILKSTREIPHVEIIRIGTRVPCALPQKINSELCNMLKKYHPIWINTHFNHPNEITEESKKACTMLADAGIPLGCQTVLLKGVNDSVGIMKELMQKLVKMRVRPYYIYQADTIKGTKHFRTRVEKGLEIIEGLRGHTSGLCVPHFVIDAPGGGGKIPLLPQYVLKIDDEKIALRNYENKNYEYPQPD